MTINSLFYNLNEEIIEDWTGFGISDLELKWARTPLSPNETLKDDPLRALRILRFASRFQLKICPDVEQALREPELKVWLLKKISRERIRIELEKMIIENNCLLAVDFLEKFELFDVIFMIEGLKIGGAAQWVKDFKGSKFKFEKFLAGLMLKYTPTTVNHSGKIMKITDYVADHSLKLSKKQKDVVCKFVEYTPIFEKLSKKFDTIQAGMAIKKLGEHWEEILDLLPPSSRNPILHSIDTSSLSTFWNESALLRVSTT